jgi:hypothetical protein
VIWSVEPDVVRAATQVCAGLAREASPELAERLPEPGATPAPAAESQLRLAAAITARTLGRLG